MGLFAWLGAQFGGGASTTPASLEQRDLPGGDRWRETTELLYQYLQRQMADARRQREELYPKTWSNQVQRTVPLVWRVSRELAKLYHRTPTRTHVLAGGEPVPREAQALIDRINAGARLDRRLRTAHEHLRAMNNATVWVWPVPQLRGVRFVVVPPHHQHVTLTQADVGGSFLSDDERDVASWRVKLPVGQDADTGMRIFAIARITATEAVWEEGPEELVGEGVWTRDGSNPIGVIPAVVLRGSDPAPGDFWAPAAEDLLDAQRAVNHDYTDIGHVARLQGYGQPWMKGIQSEVAAEMEFGPETAIGHPDPSFQFDFARPAPDLAGYHQQMEGYVRGVISANGLSPQTLLKSAGVTAQAKRLEMLDRDEERERDIDEFMRAEQRIYGLTRQWVTWLRGVDVLPDAQVRVQYHTPHVPTDPLHEAQAADLEMAAGLTSPQRTLAHRHGISLEEAKRMHEEIRTEQDEAGYVPRTHNAVSGGEGAA